MNPTEILQQYYILEQNCSQVKIKSVEKLKEYITFCIDNDQGHKIKFKTSLHHILPRSSFKQFESLSAHPWNGTHLSHKDHYTAHYLLIYAIEDCKMSKAFFLMHNSKFEHERISEKDYFVFKEEYLKELSLTMTGITLSEETKKKISKALKGKKKNYDVWQKGKPLSPQQKQNLSEKMTGRKTSIEVKQKLSDIRKLQITTKRDGSSLTFQEETNKKSEISKNMMVEGTGLTVQQLSTKRMVETMSKKDPKTKKNMYDKIIESKRKIDEETGLSIFQVASEKTKITMSQDNGFGITRKREAILKGIKTKKTVNPETGLTGFQEANRKSAKTLKYMMSNGYKKKSKNTYQIFDAHGDKVDEISENFVKYCKEHQYPYDAFKKSYKEKEKVYTHPPREDKYKKFIGWQVKLSLH